MEPASVLLYQAMRFPSGDQRGWRTSGGAASVVAGPPPGGTMRQVMAPPSASVPKRMFVPSGGGKWVIEAPYVMAAANAWKVHLGWTVQIYNAAEALPNLVNPFWMLPLMGVLNVRARDLAGYSILQLMFHAPIVVFLCWLFARTLPYIPPVIP